MRLYRRLTLFLSWVKSGSDDIVKDLRGVTLTRTELGEGKGEGIHNRAEQLDDANEKRNQISDDGDAGNPADQEADLTATVRCEEVLELPRYPLSDDMPTLT